MLATKEEIFARIVNYAQDSINSKITTCQKNKWACARFLNDLERQLAPDFPYYFDSDEVYRFYRWGLLFRHTKGVLKGKPIDLADPLLFECGNILGWKHQTTHLRRFRKAYISKARKNVKTQVMALISSYIAFLGEDEQHEVYIGGWDKEQSNLCYKEIITQLSACNLLKDKYTTSYGRITHLKSGSIIRALSREARNTGDGTNPSLGIIDEYHAHKTSEIYDVIYSGMAAREEPLMIIITTAGFNLNGPCYTEYKYVSKLLNPDMPEYQNEEYFVFICELDDGDDYTNLDVAIKANPIVATYPVGIQYLKSAILTAQQKPEDKRKVITKNFNIWVQLQQNGYMDMAKWRACERPISISDYTGQRCRIGVDLSLCDDLTAVGWEFEHSKDVYAVFAHGFMPQEKYEQRLQEAILPWDVWVEQDYLTIVPEPVVNYSYIETYIEKEITNNDLEAFELCYDPYSAKQFAFRMSDKGFNTVMVRQGYPTLSEPTKRFRESVLQQQMIHGPNGLLDFCTGNAVVKIDDKANIKLDKEKSDDKIDLLAALMNTHVRYCTGEEEIDTDKELQKYMAMMGWS